MHLSALERTGQLCVVPFLVGELGVQKHTDLQFQKPKLMYVHVTYDNLLWALDGIIQNNITSRTNAKNDII